MRSVLVTGGAGFIGSHLVDALVARGDSVRVLDNLSTGKRENLADHLAAGRVELVEGDIRDAEAVGRAMQGIELVFHEAALASVPRSIEAPLESHHACATGTLTVLDQARRAGVKRLVYAASSSCYGDQPQSSKRETDPPAPLSPYAAAKLAGEMYCQAFYHSFGLETVGLRYFNVFGPRQDPKGAYAAVIPRFITAIIAGEPITVFGDGQQSRDFTYVANVVEGNLLAAEAPGVAGQMINMANGRSDSLIQLIESIEALLGCRAQVKREPARVGDVRDSLADISLARRLLAYEPRVDLVEGLRRSLEYYQLYVAANPQFSLRRE
ncbi:MAG: SDR family oxidoreductase [Pirellulales bacterium]